MFSLGNTYHNPPLSIESRTIWLAQARGIAAGSMELVHFRRNTWRPGFQNLFLTNTGFPYWYRGIPPSSHQSEFGQGLAGVRPPFHRKLFYTTPRLATVRSGSGSGHFCLNLDSDLKVRSRKPRTLTWTSRFRFGGFGSGLNRGSTIKNGPDA